MPEEGRRSVTFPEGLLRRVERFLQENPEAGYDTPTEFLRAAARALLREEEDAAHLAAEARAARTRKGDARASSATREQTGTETPGKEA